jgi:hypothetical protein
MITVTRIDKPPFAQSCTMLRLLSERIYKLSELYAQKMIAGADTRKTEQQLKLYREVLGDVKQEIYLYRRRTGA